MKLIVSNNIDLPKKEMTFREKCVKEYIERRLLNSKIIDAIMGLKNDSDGQRD